MLPVKKNTDINFLLSINVNSKSPRKFELDRIDSMLKQKQTNKIRQKSTPAVYFHNRLQSCSVVHNFHYRNQVVNQRQNNNQNLPKCGKNKYSETPQYGRFIK